MAIAGSLLFAACAASDGGEALHSGGGALHIGGCKVKAPLPRATKCSRGEMRGAVRCCGGNASAVHQQCISVCAGRTRGGADVSTCIMAQYATLAEAEVECASHGRRLCTVQEHDLHCCSTGCHYDQRAVWVKAPQCGDSLAPVPHAAVPHGTDAHDMRGPIARHAHDMPCRVAQHSEDGIGHQVEGTLSVMGLHGVSRSVELSRCSLSESACRHNRARNDGGQAALKGCGTLVRRHEFAYDGCSPLLRDIRGPDRPPHLPIAVEHLEGGPRREALAWLDDVRQRFCAYHPLRGVLGMPALRVEKVLHLSNMPATCRTDTIYALDNAWVAGATSNLPRSFLRAAATALGPARAPRGRIHVVIHQRTFVRRSTSRGLKQLPALIARLSRVLPGAHFTLHCVPSDGDPQLCTRLNVGSVPNIRRPHNATALDVLRDMAHADVLVLSQSAISNLGSWLSSKRSLVITPVRRGEKEDYGVDVFTRLPPNTLTFDEALSGSLNVSAILAVRQAARPSPLQPDGRRLGVRLSFPNGGQPRIRGSPDAMRSHWLVDGCKRDTVNLDSECAAPPARAAVRCCGRSGRSCVSMCEQRLGGTLKDHGEYNPVRSVGLAENLTSARAMCRRQSMDLCTRHQLQEQDLCCKTGCASDARLVWTADACSQAELRKSESQRADDMALRYSTASQGRLLFTSTIGGGGNQRECIINAALAAHAMGLCLVLPRTFLVFHAGQEHGRPGRRDYVAPYRDAPRGGGGMWSAAFGLMFDEKIFRARLSNLSICTVSPAELGPGDHSDPVPLPRRMPSGSPGQLRRAFDRLATVAPSSGPARFSLGTCFQWLITRGESEDCRLLGPGGLCRGVTEALVLPPPARNVVTLLLARLRGLTAAEERPYVRWHALHFKKFGCKQGVSNDAFEALIAEVHAHVAQLTPSHNATRRHALYIISEVRSAELRAAAGRRFRHAVWKEDLLPRLRDELPFEVLGQIDFATGDAISRGGTYFGEATSSSDLPIYARRTRAGEAWAQLGHGRICKRGHAT